MYKGVVTYHEGTSLRNNNYLERGTRRRRFNNAGGGNTKDRDRGTSFRDLSSVGIGHINIHTYLHTYMLHIF